MLDHLTPDDGGYWNTAMIAEAIADGLRRKFPETGVSRSYCNVHVNENRIEITMSNGDTFHFAVSPGKPWQT